MPSRLVSIVSLGGGLLAGCAPQETSSPAPVPDPFVELTAITTGNGLFVAVGGTRSTSRDGMMSTDPLVEFSENGTQWTRAVLNERGIALSGIAHGNDSFVAIGSVASAGTVPAPGEVTLGTRSAVVMVSADARSWSKPILTEGGWSDIAFGNGHFVATRQTTSMTYAIVTSTDGRTWDEVDSGKSWGVHVLFLGERFVAFHGDRVGVSRDGSTWTWSTVPSNPGILAIGYGDGRYVLSAMTDCCGGEIPDRQKFFTASSPDGTAWELTQLSTRHWPKALTHGNRTWISITQGGVWRSTDAISWQQAYATSAYTSMSDVTFAANKFVAVGANQLLTSADGTVWTPQKIP